MSVYFTSDTHFCHLGVITKERHTWCSSIDDMNQRLIVEHNAVVKPEDVTYNLGDVSFAGLGRTAEILRQINGTYRVVPGNHDDKKMLRRLVEMELIELLPPLFDLKVDQHRIVLCHFPLLSWSRMQHGALHFHGHCHGSLTEVDSRRADVGVDTAFGHGPVLLETVVNTLYARNGEYVDHHYPKLAA